MSFEFLATEHQLEVVDRNSTTFRSEHKYWLKASRPERFFIRQYSWSGAGVEREPVPEVVTSVDKWGFPKQRIHGPLLCEDKQRTLIVDLGRTLSEGEEEFIHFRHKMKDLNRKFEPRLSAKPTTKVTNQILLRVTLPAWDELNVRYERFEGGTKKIVASSELMPTNSENGRLTFETTILNPNEDNCGHKIEWSHRGS